MNIISKYRKFSAILKNLSIDMVENANSGHPGAPMGMADFISVLALKFLNFDSKNPDWINRDRLIFSNGHASALLYSLLFSLGFEKPTLDDLKGFRKLGSKTAGHPEFGHLKGVETTTGPLGQGLASAVGSAIASKKFESELGRDLINHKIYVTVGDGCLMEGISHEAASLAGHLGLNNLIALFDSNQISIDGPTSLSDSTNTKLRFEAYGWNVFEADGHNFSEIELIFKKALELSNMGQKPILIIFNTTIGKGANKKSGSAASHGAPLGKEEFLFAKHEIFKDLGFDESKINEFFLIDEKFLKETSDFIKEARINDLIIQWNERFESFKAQNPEKFKFLFSKDHFHDSNKEFQKLFDSLIEKYLNFENGKKESTRKSSGLILEELIKTFPNFIGSSADLSESNCVLNKFSKIINKENGFSGNFLHVGIREHAAQAICNGIACYNKNFIPFFATFLIFSDYARPAIRLSALMGLQILMIFTHDSIFLGEDGPTHQPIEQLGSLRMIPNLLVFRPADFFETLVSYKLALLNQSRPSVFSLSRQNLPQIKDLVENFDSKKALEQIYEGGAYVVKEKKSFSKERKKIIILATGSEVSLAISILNKFNENNRFDNIEIKIVSILSTRLFDESSDEFKEFILENENSDVVSLRVIIEASETSLWTKYIIGSSPKKSLFIGLESFGASGNEKDLRDFFGFTENKIFEKILEKILT